MRGTSRKANRKEMDGKNLKLLGKVTVVEAEARSVQEAIRWIEELELQNVTGGGS